jgi:hypothetical protein
MGGMRTALLVFLILLVAGNAHARWIVRYEWRPDPRFIEPAPLTRAEMRQQLCTLEAGPQGYREAEIRALRCARRLR